MRVPASLKALMGTGLMFYGIVTLVGEREILKTPHISDACMYEEAEAQRVADELKQRGIPVEPISKKDAYAVMQRHFATMIRLSRQPTGKGVPHYAGVKSYKFN